jgi:hypothetical protein
MISETVKRAVRQRLGLDADDTSRDAEIESTAPMKLLRDVCGWHIGDPAWADSFIEWAKGCGFDVTQKPD